MATTKRSDTHEDGRMAVVRHLRDDLIRSRIREGCDKERLDRAIRQSVTDGASVDSLSEASGYPPSEVRKISESHSWDEDLTALAGVA